MLLRVVFDFCVPSLLSPLFLYLRRFTLKKFKNYAFTVSDKAIVKAQQFNERIFVCVARKSCKIPFSKAMHPPFDDPSVISELLHFTFYQSYDLIFTFTRINVKS